MHPRCCPWHYFILFYGWLVFHCRSRQWHPTPVLLPGNPGDRGAWWAAVHGVAESRAWLKRLSSSSSSSSIPLYVLICTASSWSFLCWWTFRLFPWTGYCEQCCCGHWGTYTFSIYSFVWICAQEWTCWIIW